MHPTKRPDGPSIRSPRARHVRRRLGVSSWLLTALLVLGSAPVAAEGIQLTPNVPIEKYQDNLPNKPYDFNAPPEGLFRSIQFAHRFEEELGVRRTHEFVPVSVTDVFSPTTPTVFLVFEVFQHLDSYEIHVVCYPEQVEGLNPEVAVASDAVYVALEDNTGYLRLDAPDGGWTPGTYKVEVHVGWMINELSLVGTMRFRVKAEG